MIDQLVPFTLALRTRFRRVERRHGVLLHGAAGWGEFAPFDDYPAAVTARWLRAAISAAEEPFPTPLRTSVPVNSIIPAVAPDRAAALAVAAGCRTVKVKVAEPGESLAHDRDRVAAVRAAMGPAARIRVDANMAWDVPTAVQAIGALDAWDLEYVEQPCATLGELAEVRRRVDVAIAADESIRTADDPLRAAATAAVDLIVVKVAPLGGVARALEVVDTAGLPAVVSSAVDTSVGLAAGVALAAALPDLPFACGLGTGLLLAADVTDAPLLPVDGAVGVGRIAPTRSLLETAAPPPEEAGWLLERMAQAQAVLAGSDGPSESVASESVASETAAADPDSADPASADPATRPATSRDVPAAQGGSHG